MKKTRKKSYKAEYKDFWKKIVENPDGTINKDQIMRELSDFSELIVSLSTLYCHVTGGTVSKPMTQVKHVTKLFDEQVSEAYDRGYKDAEDDYELDDLDYALSQEETT